MVRLVLTWTGHPLAFELRPGLNRFGRNPTNDCRISDPSVSSFHAEIQVSGEGIHVRDLGSTNGTFIGSQRIQEAMLAPGGSLRIGQVELQLEEVLVTAVASAENTAPHRGSASSATLPRACQYHPGQEGIYQCANCGGVFCADCVKVVGHDRLNTMTICAVCGGQCDHLPAAPAGPEKKRSFLARLTQTLKMPFAP